MSQSAKPLLSIIVPVFNEELGMSELFRRLIAAGDVLTAYALEVLLISDGSSDRTNDLIRDKVKGDCRFQGVILARNFGHQAAVSVGLERAKGDFVVIIDGDLQDPPEIIGQLLEAVARDADVAYAVRAKRKENAIKRFFYASFYRVLRRVADIDIPLDAGDFCCMRRCVVDAMLQLPERNRFVRGLRAWVGFRQIPVVYERDARFAGNTRYTLRKLIRLANDGFFGFSSLPIRIMQVLGFVISAGALGVALMYLLWYLVSPGAFPAGFATLAVSLWFLSGVQLLFMGFVGEYVIRTYDECRGRPTAIVSAHWRYNENNEL